MGKLLLGDEPIIRTVHEAMAWREAYLDADTFEEKERIYQLWQRWEKRINGEVGACLRELLAKYYPDHDASHVRDFCEGNPNSDVCCTPKPQDK